MVTRRTLLIDRIATLVLSLALLIGGATAIWWWTGRSLGGHTLVQRTDTSRLADLVAAGWFPWAAAVVGVLLALIGLRWIAAHLRADTVKRLALRGSDATGRLDVLATKVAGAAADELGDTLGVRSAQGVVRRDRGQLVAQIGVTLEPDADLALIAERADEVSALLGQVLGRDDIRCRFDLHVARVRALPRAQ